ncbi:hypothetical protein [uncultured Shewanella sp.]|uniref:Imm32 family immunity protein n=1 Tax=Shewanella atlantica TaxID=271099 RepID=UPI00261BD621|nr:hypothetical protein [uncultured Shewanella sp.]
MKIYGYEKTEDDSDLIEMSEVTITASPKCLREIASFINKMADELESDGASFEHSHLQDNWPDWDSHGPDIIVGPSAI